MNNEEKKVQIALDQNLKENLEPKGEEKSLKKALQSKTLDTYLKNQSKLLLSSISIADKKAAILIRLNTSLVSGLIILESYFNVDSNLNEYLITFLIIGLSLSLLFAILVSKPFSFSLYKILNKVVKRKYPKLEENNFFLIGKVSLDDYEESMEKVINSQKLQIGNLTRYNYFMSRSISQKFILLEVAYSIFLITLMGVVFIYVFSKFS